MGVAIEIGADELGRAIVRLDALLRATGDLTPLMGHIGAALESSTMERFERGAGPDGKRWKPSIRARATGGQTLVDTGRGRDSITHHASRDRVEVGTNVAYMATHQTGATIRAKEGGRLKFTIPGIGFRSPEEVVIPKREFLGIDRDDLLTVEELVDAYIEGALQ